MAEMTPIPSVQRSPESAYQPVSGFAVASAISAGFFALALVVVTIVSLTSSRAALWWWLLGLPAAAVVLAAVGRSHIRNSEGTRTGMRLANISWWVSVLGGVGFAAYLYANSLAWEYESGKFTDQMFRELEPGDRIAVQTAFRNHMVPPEERSRCAEDRPADEFEAAFVPAGYTFFRNHELIRTYERNPKQVTFERVKVKESGQEAAGLYVTHVYRITCPEGIFETQVKAVATEAKKGGKPLWRIPAQPTPNISALTIVELSRFGSLTRELTIEGDAFMRMWMDSLSGHRNGWAQLLTTSMAERQAVTERILRLSALGGGTSALFGPGQELLPPDRAAAWKRNEAIAASGESFAKEDLFCEDLAGIGFFRSDSAGNRIPDEKMKRLRQLWRNPNLQPNDGRSTMMDNVVPLVPMLTILPDRIRFVMAADLYMQGGSPIHYRCIVTAECKDPALMAGVEAIRKRGLEDKADASFILATLPPRDWQVVSFQTNLEPLTPVGPGSPMPGRQ